MGCSYRGRRRRYFYPRSPRGERLNHFFHFIFRSNISIHAPREGSDNSDLLSVQRQFNFYPRSPRGERPLARRFSAARWDFYPRSPRGERRGFVMQSEWRDSFLSTLPARGATAKPNKNTAGFCAKGPNADLGCTKRESQFCAISMIFLRAGAVRRGFAGANLPVRPCALGLRTGGGRRPDYTSSTSSWDHCGARPMCSTRVL